MANLTINKSKIKKIDIINIKGGLTAKQVYEKYKPDIFMNLALYDTKSGTNITFLEDENVKDGYLFSNKGIGIKGDKEIVWTEYSQAFNDKDIRDFVSGSPSIVENSLKKIDWGNKYSSYVDGVHNRSFIGFNDESIILCCSDNKLSIDATATTAVNLGMKYAINLDGGGSSHLQEGNKVLKKSTRANVSWLLIYLNKEQEDGDYMAKNYINQTGKSQPVYETTAWTKRIGFINKDEQCIALMEGNDYFIVLYNIDNTPYQKVGFIKK